MRQARLRAPMAAGIRHRDLGLLLLLAALWGSAFMFIAVGLESFTPMLFAALRFDIVALVVGAVAIARRRGPLVPQNRRQWTAVAIAAGLNIAAYHALLFWGELEASPGIAAIIVGLSPLLTVCFSGLLLRDDRVGAAGLAGLLLGFGGVVLLATLRGGDLLDAQGLAELAVLGAIASWALGSVLVKRTAHGMDVATFITWQCLGGAALLHALAFAFEGGGSATLDAPGLASLLYLSLASSAVGFVIYFTLLERIGPIRVNLVSEIAPLFATLATVAAVALGHLTVADPFEGRAVLAFALIAAGFFLVMRPAPALRPSPAAAGPPREEPPLAARRR